VKRCALALLALLALGCPTVEAHVVPVGVGAQSEIRVSPRRVEVKFNLGFSSLLGIGQLKLMDTDGDGVIRRPERAAYVKQLGERLIPQLQLHLDGKRLELKVISERGLGILGPIEAVGFDTWYELEAACDLGPGEHVLTYFDGTFQGEQAEQLLWLPMDDDVFAAYDMTQQVPNAISTRGKIRSLKGRDVTITFAFEGEALERDQALALLEPSLDGLARAAGALRDGLARDVEGDLNLLAFRGVRFTQERRAEIPGGLPLAKERTESDGAPKSLPAAPVDDDDSKMQAAYSQPFSLLFLLFFLGWGASHALAPGHGKTLVAAYLLGSEGRISDAFKLGAIVTATHMFALYTVGLGIVWLVSESDWGRFLGQTTQHLTLLSGLGLIAYGAYLAWDRWKAITPKKAPVHDHGHGHDHDHSHDHGHDHDHGALNPEEHAAAHAQEAASITSLRDLLVLGVTGGLVPCPAGVTLVIFSVSFEDQNTLKCFVYLTAFSLGLAGVLIAVAVSMVLSKKYLISSTPSARTKRVLEILPFVSCVLICIVGVGLCLQAYYPTLLPGLVAKARAFVGM
jgi:ABC-type nickel/cobalt efflux system permease component RcnA